MIVPALVEMRQIAKTFGPVVALNGVDFTVHSDEVVGLVGDNGAGKSTLMKILTGVHQPDAGEVWLAGTRVRFHSPLESRRNGIEMVYQDLGLAENLNAIANIFLGREVTHRTGGLRLLSEGEMERQGRGHLNGLQISLPSVFLPVERLSGGQRQSVAIARATAFRAQLVIMDEPAASLAVTEATKVLALIKRLREQGVSVVLISHRLQDVFDVSDRIVVLNRGSKVGDLRRQDTTMEDVVGLIVGKSA
ncbi:MAG: sugar ABC transporter ATP-binding protein [Bacillati bacterium ANGP1]|uniref:Sugar ABC transporter ATP-binding protein n=1 Tax=Candidatus Segetimicrobium genomatis TaxID=2569760 RepID=A0A537IWY9_9BACT|nr:MAG: sugar ABC transporter ATP-binding protein [Terrabacteria group bacterium ANGP1]